MYKGIFFISALLFISQAADNCNNDLKCDVKVAIGMIEKLTSETKGNATKDVEYQVKQAKERGNESMKCALSAAEKMEPAVEDSMSKLIAIGNDLIKMLKELKSKDLTEEQLNEFSKQLALKKETIEPEMTQIRANVDKLLLQYAEKANAC